ncbi:hypothetical protein HMPREF3038_01255 [Akkermansia sp. KLE1797]|nr:hypothetical protein HMPREF3038_01255 [Akkermansia sp. KLE1797]KXU52837.1 hypothetical protein HMPREF3039_03003 [Akkermansia sp. KLE1798]
MRAYFPFFPFPSSPQTPLRRPCCVPPCKPFFRNHPQYLACRTEQVFFLANRQGPCLLR